MRSIRAWLKGESGQSAIIVAISMVVLCGFAALAIDIGRISVTRGQLQNAADAAALAGAQALPTAAAAQSQAVLYAGINGVSAANTTATTPFSGTSSKIEVVCRGTVPYTFARVFGLSAKDISARSVAQKQGMSGGAFGYAIFSGSTLDLMQMSSQNLTIDGSVHSNADILLTGTVKITGNAESVKSFSAYVTSIIVGGTCQGSSISVSGGSINVPTRISSPAVTIAMPDFSTELKEDASAGGSYFTTSKTYSAGIISLDSPIYVDGGSLTLNGNSFTGQGCMVATGNIQVNGNLTRSGSSSSICLYSKTGDIQINTSVSRIDGSLYAPNGIIQINGNVTINGRIIAKKVQINGSTVNIISSSGDLACLPGTSVSLVE
ncbi:hypothetical protein SDC9_92870 [bioreactor metagenome]|uniref:Uncharacterized protein n=1 Tax=bioreactor metagenome TaxID=1076179 RepID=A0A644ZZH1_9ZZZZ|nr:pilus assembly protein TadG-related protein [Christensenella sp.]